MSKALYTLAVILNRAGSWLAYPGLWIIELGNKCAEKAEELRVRQPK